ncbi:MAG: methionyl-tRNA formyltransferase [Bacteroidota bacterium]|nr:methionyl-tRNA formyltransferase [Bacteroidota bacterium]MDP4226750.1 methionyl-tRNA formyltransferase [Bacteroidota bacterium]MDP4273741.1 methionyl-tRNA formyltransferase [Bacteroidota bacterium]
MRIVFMGTPEFAVATLKTLIDNNYEIAAVVTAPDKPAGRGKKLQASEVKKFALERNLPVLQPEKLKNPEFLAQLKALNADLQVVVAFRMLPEVVWSMPPKGTINLHASLLPQYRGAAPINWAVINGEKESGVTTFFISKDIDTGEIIYQETVPIGPDQTAGELHDKLMETGAGLLLKTVKDIENGSYPHTRQSELTDSGALKPAPKIFKENCKIDWNKPGKDIHNFIRGLSPYPTAWTEIRTGQDPDQKIPLKIFLSSFEENHIVSQSENLGKIFTDNKKYIKVAVLDGFIYLKSLQLPGHGCLSAEEFLRGFRDTFSIVL